jgi:FkbM family methyltransferase
MAMRPQEFRNKEVRMASIPTAEAPLLVKYQAAYKKYPDAPDRFEATIREIYSHVCRRGSVLFDIGAHTGKHTIPMAIIVGKEGAVFAFEPILEKFKTLCDNVAKGDLPQVHLFNVCCYDKNQIVNFTYLPKDPGKSSINIREALRVETVEKLERSCIAIRLDDFIAGSRLPEFMKIDVEGAEYNVLLGAEQIIRGAKPIVHVEIGAVSLAPFGRTPSAVFEFLRSVEYEVFDIFGNRLPDVSAFVESSSIGSVYDYLALPAQDLRVHQVRQCCKRMWEL